MLVFLQPAGVSGAMSRGWDLTRGDDWVQAGLESGGAGLYVLCRIVKALPGAGSPTITAEGPAAGDAEAEGFAEARIGFSGREALRRKAEYTVADGKAAVVMEDLVGEANLWFAAFLDGIETANRVRIEVPSIGFDVDLALPRDGKAFAPIRKDCVKRAPR